MQYIAVFSVRNHTLQFNMTMNRRGFRCDVISTPKRISSVCGVSARFSDSALNYAKALAKTYSSFIGIYALGNEFVSPNGQLFRKI